MSRAARYGTALLRTYGIVLAFVVLAYVRPSALQATLWPLACLSAGASALLLVPVALVLGGSSTGALGVASMAFSAVTWLLLATGVLTPAAPRSATVSSAVGSFVRRK